MASQPSESAFDPLQNLLRPETPAASAAEDAVIVIPVHIADYRSAHIPPTRRTAWEWIVDYNPFYLLSAVSMLLGCLLLANTTTWQPVPLSTLLPLLGTLQIYELACLGIGVLLYRRLGPRRDAVQLLGLVLLFAVDISFLMIEVATDSLAAGAVVAVVLFVLAGLKAAAIVSVLKLRLYPAYVLTGMAGLFVLYATPPLLAAVDAGRGLVEVVHLYWLWWVIALSPLIFDAARWMYGPAEGRTNPGAEPPRATFVPAGVNHWLLLIAVLPWASLAVHAAMLHYVYNRPFMAPLAAPVLVGIALLMRPRKNTFDYAVLRTILLGVAALISMPDPARLSITLPVLNVQLGSALVGLSAAWLTFAYMNAPALLPWLVSLGVAGLLLNWFGPSLQQMAAVLRSFIEFVRDVTAALVPRTRAVWGTIAVCLAFTFLALGALVSFGRRTLRG